MEQHLRGRGTTFMEFNKSYANELRLAVADPVRTLQPHLPGWIPAWIGRALRRFRVLQLIKPAAGRRRQHAERVRSSARASPSRT
jgi:hypothetical protein